MKMKLYPLTRDLHLYIGLFLSPFVLLFAFSVLFLVHAHPPAAEPDPHPRTVSDLSIPPGVETLTGIEQVNALRPLLEQAGVHGEVNFIRHLRKAHHLIVPVVLPGRETTVDLDLAQHSATVSVRSTGFADTLVHLHRMPGPHNASLRGNSPYMRAWRWLTDAASYGVLFLTLSGVYLWAALSAERSIGILLLTAGAISLLGLAYAVAG